VADARLAVAKAAPVVVRRTFRERLFCREVVEVDVGRSLGLDNVQVWCPAEQRTGGAASRIGAAVGLRGYVATVDDDG